MATNLDITLAFVDTFVNDSAHDSAVVTALGGGNVKVIFAEGITSIPTNCFKDQTNIVAVEFSSTVASIGASAFEGCTGLVSLSLPASAVAIASDAFKGCTALKNMDARALETKAGEALQITADKFAIVHNTVYDDTALAQRVTNAESLWVPNAENTIVSTDKNIGIGTQTPNTKLEVNGVARINDRLELQRAGGPNYIDFRSGEPFHLRAHDISNSANSQNRMTIDGNGNVGIGTTNPKALLNTNNYLTGGDHVIRPAGSGNTQYNSESLWLGKSVTGYGNNYYGLSLGTQYAGNSYIQALHTGNDGAPSGAYYNLSLQPHGGNIGIGTVLPSEKLEVAGDMKATGKLGIGTDSNGIDAMLHVKSTTNSRVPNIKQSVGSWYAGTDTYNYCEFYNANESKTMGIEYDFDANTNSSNNTTTNRHTKMSFLSNNGPRGTEIWDQTDQKTTVMTLLSEGKVGIGTTTPSQKLDVSGKVNVSEELYAGKVGIGGIGSVYPPLTDLHLYNTYPNIRVSHTQTGYLQFCSAPPNIEYGASPNHTDVQIFGNWQGIGFSSRKNNMYASMFHVSSNGKVLIAGGITTSNTAIYPLEVYGDTESPYAPYWGPDGLTAVSSGLASNNWGVYVHSGGVFAAHMGTPSDRRIKTEISPIQDSTALQQVVAIESKEYHYIDPMRRRQAKTVGFIAQEVKEVVPNAVSIITEVIPDELRLIEEPVWETDGSNNFLIIDDLEFSESNTGKCRFHLTDDLDHKGYFGEVECERDSSGNYTNKFKFDNTAKYVFLYGKEVNDFHALDKNQIFALHHSAIQELSRKNGARETSIQHLENENTQLKADNTQLKADIALIKQKLGL